MPWLLHGLGRLVPFGDVRLGAPPLLVVLVVLVVLEEVLDQLLLLNLLDLGWLLVSCAEGLFSFKIIFLRSLPIEEFF